MKKAGYERLIAGQGQNEKRRVYSTQVRNEHAGKITNVLIYIIKRNISFSDSKEKCYSKY
jgi:hypothetical protein